MKVNTKKTKIMPFIFSKKYDFIPRLAYNCENLDVVYQTKLLGIICCSDGKWYENSKYLAGKGFSKLYFLRRLKDLKASVETLREVYILFVRSTLELCAPLWSGALDRRSAETLERVQRSALRILQPNEGYQASMKSLNLETPDERRLNLTKKFAKKMANDPKFQYLFPLKTGPNTRSNNKYLEPVCKTNRYKNSAIPQFIRLLNQNEN